MQYINAENEERYFHFRKSKNKVNGMVELYRQNNVFNQKKEFEYDKQVLRLSVKAFQFSRPITKRNRPNTTWFV